MQISKTSAVMNRRTRHERRMGAERRQQDQRQSQSRALVPLQPQSSDERTFVIARRPAASFVAHLIATQIQAPQTRARRREELDVVVAAYRAAGPTVPATGRALRMSA